MSGIADAQRLRSDRDPVAGRAGIGRVCVPTLATVAAVAVFVAAGNWQQAPHARQGSAARAVRRRRARGAGRRSRACRPVRTGRRCGIAPSPRRANICAQQQILIDNKVHGGPRRLSRRDAARRLPTAASCSSTAAGSRSSASRAELPAAPPPAGQVTVHGRLAFPPAGYLELKPDATRRPGLAEPRPGALRRGDGPRRAAGGHRGDGRARRPTTGSSASGRRRTSASRSTGSTWCSGTRSRCSPPCCGSGSIVRARGARAMTERAVPPAPPAAPPRRGAAQRRGARCC